MNGKIMEVFFDASNYFRGGKKLSIPVECLQKGRAVV